MLPCVSAQERFLIHGDATSLKGNAGKIGQKLNSWYLYFNQLQTKGRGCKRLFRCTGSSHAGSHFIFKKSEIICFKAFIISLMMMKMQKMEPYNWCLLAAVCYL